MDPQELDFQHQTLLNSLKGTLANGDDDSLYAARQALSWASQAMGDTFDPHRPVKDGAPIGELLLQRATKHFNPRFMDEWIERFGIQSVFPESAGTRLISHWISSIRKQLASSHASLATSDAPLLTWLLERAPASAVPLDPLPAIADQLEKQREDKGLHVAFDRLLTQVSKHASSQIDPMRPPLRWLPSSVLLGQSLDLSVLVVCPSGLTRTLKDLALLRAIPAHNDMNHYGAVEKPGGSPSTIPKLPHGRKLELARHWVLDPRITVDTARARLWACAEEKPEAVEQLMAWMKTPPRGSPDFSGRIEELLLARDSFGRGIQAWMACSHREESPFLMRRIGLLIGSSDDDLLSSDGHGLVEQLLVGRRQGFSNDAFHGRDVSKWGKANLDSQYIAGPADRQDGIIADLVDVAIPFGIQDSLLATMEQATADPRLSTAHAWSRFFECVRHPPKDSSHYNSRRSNSSYSSDCSDRLSKRIAQITKTMTENPGALAIGAVEWRQWGPLFLEKCQTYDIQTSFQKTLTNAMPGLERLMDASSMHMSVPKAPSRAGPRF